jgi:hypothetical protein
MVRQITGSGYPFAGFGASDCRCRTHLISFPSQPALPEPRPPFRYLARGTWLVRLEVRDMTKRVGKAKAAGRSSTGMAGAEGLVTAGKLAAAWGTKAGDVKKAIAAAGVRPDATRCGCAYYGPATVARIKKQMLKG